MACDKTVRQSAINAFGIRTKSDYQETAKLRNAGTVENLPPEQKLELAQGRTQHTTTETTFFGPIPPPDVLQQYQDIFPDAPGQFFAMAGREQQLRAEEQAAAFKNERKKISAALWADLALLAVAGVAAWHGNAYIALPLGLARPLFALLRYLMRADNGRFRLGGRRSRSFPFA